MECFGPYAPFLVSNYFGVKRVPPPTDQSVPMPLKLPGGWVVKNPPATQKTRIPSLGQEDSLEKEMAAHSSILVWEIPWIEELSDLQSMGSQRVGQDWRLNTAQRIESKDPLAAHSRSRLSFPSFVKTAVPSGGKNVSSPCILGLYLDLLFLTFNNNRALILQIAVQNFPFAKALEMISEALRQLCGNRCEHLCL